MKPQLGLTVPQQIKFRRLVDSAWLAFALRHDVDHHDKAAKRQWYEGELFQCAHVHSTTELCATPAVFDAMLLHFAIIANDADEIARQSESAERRLRWQIERRLEELTYLQGRPITWDYAVTTYSTMKVSIPLAEAPAAYLLSVHTKLDVYVRRLLDERHIPPCVFRATMRQYRAMEKAYA